ncbi:hypothetical protein MTO96_033547, partial [Rhipicephalus appendiculatus]
DRPLSLEQQVRLHGVHSKLHATKHGHQGGVTGGGDSGATVVTAVVSICVLAGLLFSVVLSRVNKATLWCPSHLQKTRRLFKVLSI